MNEQQRQELIAHIRRESAGCTPTANDEFDIALFSARFDSAIKTILEETKG